MALNNTPRINVSITGVEPQEFKSAWRSIALYCGFRGREGGDISGLLSAIASLPEDKRHQLEKFLLDLLTVK